MHCQKRVSRMVIGGNRSLAGVKALSCPMESGHHGIRVVGLSASIFHDIGHTRLSIGVDTAMNTLVEAYDPLSQTAEARDRVFYIEVMGRDCGQLAMATSVAAAADVV